MILISKDRVIFHIFGIDTVDNKNENIKITITMVSNLDGIKSQRFLKNLFLSLLLLKVAGIEMYFLQALIGPLVSFL